MVIIVILCQALELHVTKQVNDSIKDKEAVEILPCCLQGYQAAVLYVLNTQILTIQKSKSISFATVE